MEPGLRLRSRWISSRASFAEVVTEFSSSGTANTFVHWLAPTMAFSKLRGDEQRIILGRLRNTLEPRLIMYFSSASKELRALLPPAAQQQLRADYEEATALCHKVGMRDCKELREASRIEWDDKSLSAADSAAAAED